MADFETFPGDYELSAAFLNTSGMIFTGTHHFQLSLAGDWDKDFARLVELLETFEACSVESEADSDGGDTALTVSSVAEEEGS
jgi:hypothetical protein